jgi:uncharacterized membrane protein YkoI
MNRRTKGILIGAGAIAALAGGGAAVAGAAGGDDDDGRERAISGGALERATAAALERTGGGRVTETETGDEGSYYKVEVTRADGAEVEVQLDRGFNVVGSETDGSEDDDGSGDD